MKEYYDKLYQIGNFIPLRVHLTIQDRNARLVQTHQLMLYQLKYSETRRYYSTISPYKPERKIRSFAKTKKLYMETIF